MQLKCAACSIQMKIIWAIEITICFDVILLNNADSFDTTR